MPAAHQSVIWRGQSTKNKSNPESGIPLRACCCPCMYGGPVPAAGPCSRTVRSIRTYRGKCCHDTAGLYMRLSVRQHFPGIHGIFLRNREKSLGLHTDLRGTTGTFPDALFSAVSCGWNTGYLDRRTALPACGNDTQHSPDYPCQKARSSECLAGVTSRSVRVFLPLLLFTQFFKKLFHHRAAFFFQHTGGKLGLMVKFFHLKQI